MATAIPRCGTAAAPPCCPTGPGPRRRSTTGARSPATSSPGVGSSFAWRGGRLTEIPLLPEMPEASMMQAQGINNRGQVVGFGGFDGFAWDSDTGTLSTLPGLSRLGPAAYDVNDRGQIVGSTGTSPENLEPHAVLLTPERR